MRKQNGGTNMQKPITYKNTTLDYWKTFGDLSYLEHFPHPEIVKSISNLSDIAHHYYEVTQKLSKTFPSMLDGRQYYTREIHLDSKSKYMYEIYWDIKKAQSIINKEDSVLYEYKTANLFPSVDQRTLNYKYLRSGKVDVNDPIIVSEFTLTNELLVIDGNHRTFLKFSENSQSSILVNMLSHEEQLEAMAAPCFQTLYKMHHNVTVMSNYMFGYIPYMTEEPSEKKQTMRLYPIS